MHADSNLSVCGVTIRTMERTSNLRYNSAVGLEFVLRANLNFRRKIKMVAGHLQIKKGYYYAVLSCNSGEKIKT